MSSMYGNQGMRPPKGNLGGYQAGQLSNFTPEMMELFKSLFSHLSPDSYTGRLAKGDQSLFQEMEAPALRQFAGLQGNIASRFSGMGTGGRHSSGFQNTATAAGSNFAQDLQSRRQDLQRQAVQDLMGLSSNLLSQRPYENFLIEPHNKKNFLEKILGGLLPLGGAALGGAFGGLPGAAIGGRAGSAAGQAFF